MRWNSDNIDGDRRIIIKYAWLPIRIKNRSVEWRWLEQVKIRQEYRTDYFLDSGNLLAELLNWIKTSLFGGFWINESFQDFDLEKMQEIN